MRDVYAKRATDAQDAQARLHILPAACVAAALLALLMLSLVPAAYGVYYSADTGIPGNYRAPIYNSIPHTQMRNVFESQTIEVSGIKVNIDRARSWEDTVHFRIFNSTTQETEYEVDTINTDGNNYLPPMRLKKNHDYIFFVEDPWYMLGTKKYVQVLDGVTYPSILSTNPATEGPGAYDYKRDANGQINLGLTYTKLKSFTVYRRDHESSDPFAENRYNTDVVDSRFPLYVLYKGQKLREDVKFKLVSDIETIETVKGADAKIKANLIEDVTYMVYVESNKYDIDPFPIVVKDKSEYGEGRYCYDHSTCNRVDVNTRPIVLYDKGAAFPAIDEAGYERITTKTSLKGRVTVEGMNFRHLILLDRNLSTAVSSLQGKDYETFDVTAVNPHRWEISKLVGAPFTITRKIPANKTVANVYALEGTKLTKLPLKASKAGEVTFTSNSLSVHPYVIEYKPNAAPKVPISKTTIGAIANATYTGKAISPSPKITYGGKTLKKGIDYTLSYKNNVKVGTATVTITGKGGYYGTTTKTFKITKPAAPKTTVKDMPVYWMYNRNTGENLYTAALPEKNALSKKPQWQFKKIVWYAPQKGEAVYRLVNKVTNDHHWTKSKTEANTLVKRGKWKMDFNGKPAFYSGGTKTVWRLRHDARIAQQKAGTHRFATSASEINTLKKSKWVKESETLKATRYR